MCGFAEKRLPDVLFLFSLGLRLAGGSSSHGEVFCVKSVSILEGEARETRWRGITAGRGGGADVLG